MQLEARHFRLAGIALCVFVVAQILQALCFLFRIPEAQAPAADYAARLGWVDRTRALAVLFRVAVLAVADAVIAPDRFARRRSPRCWRSPSPCSTSCSNCCIAAW